MGYPYPPPHWCHPGQRMGWPAEHSCISGYIKIKRPKLLNILFSFMFSQFSLGVLCCHGSFQMSAHTSDWWRIVAHQLAPDSGLTAATWSVKTWPSNLRAYGDVASLQLGDQIPPKCRLGSIKSRVAHTATITKKCPQITSIATPSLSKWRNIRN